jgi:membrane protease YdiL (CAAX protease family)
MPGRNLPLAYDLGLLMLIWWFVMVTFQGEGMELDTQRRRHPMWEWLLSHPVRPGAVFLAEMFAPLASNPNVLGAPLFWIVLLWMGGHSLVVSIGAGLLIGAPLAVAASCLSKALEIGAMLRLSPRNRGAFLALLSWVGFVSFFGVILLNSVQPPVIATAAQWLEPYARRAQVAGFRALAGYDGSGENLPIAVGLSCAVSALLTALAVWISARATREGLAGGFDGTNRVPAVRSDGRKLFRDPLYRKELLWLMRDRGALLQTILIPGTVAAFQLVNLRGLFDAAAGRWSWLCGLSAIFGTYFLFVLGPRALISEGTALWIALTWPCGLENLLRTKARFWWMLVQVPVALGFALSLYLHPEAWWQIVLVAAGWLLFSRSLAVKTVTLVQPLSPSGEPEPMPAGRRYSAMLGTFTFATGIVSQRWHLLFVGVVYSWVTAAAMWQNFRARLPFLFDSWSEKMPRPPTVMHAMVAILAMVEVISLVTGATVFAVGPDRLWLARLIAYGGTSFLTWIFMSAWLSRREVPNREVWYWREPGAVEPIGHTVASLAMGIGCGLLLGAFGHFYVQAVERFFPAFGADFEKTTRYLLDHPADHAWLALLGVICAPLAEEYLFRGLLYRALDREWGGWRAIGVSAAFFAIYHPPAAWVPVAALGAANAFLFRKTRSLWPAVLAHACYNAIVLLA